MEPVYVWPRHFLADAAAGQKDKPLPRRGRKEGRKEGQSGLSCVRSLTTTKSGRFVLILFLG